MRRSKAQQDHTSEAVPPAQVTYRPIGVVRSPYKERFGTPRQPVITEQVLGDGAQEGTIELNDDPKLVAALKDLVGFSHIWVLYHMHLVSAWGPLVKPPRGPKEKVGLFATRAPNRPNPIGLSACRLLEVEGRQVRVLGLDILDGTPVLDIKPYVPYADAFPGARTGWLSASGERADGPDSFEPLK